MPTIQSDYPSDLVALAKFTNHEWFAVPGLGKIFDQYGKEIVGSDSGKGYIVIKTSFRGIEKDVLKHRAIYIAAHGEIPEDPTLEVNHINGNKHDNRIQNLELVTHLENMHNPNTPPRKCEDHPQAKLTNDIVREIRAFNAKNCRMPKGVRISEAKMAEVFNRKYKGLELDRQHVNKIIRHELFYDLEDD